MKKIVYVFNNKEYEQTEIVKLDFIVSTNCINNFINEVGKNLCFVQKEIKEKILSNKYRQTKKVNVTCLANKMYNILLNLGSNEYSEIRNNIEIYQYKFDNSLNKIKNSLREQYIVFNPITKKSKLIFNTPIKINGKILIYCNKLYRRYKQK
jgi:SpoVK/Ycf46/Vps4 family AAA+-type ATPase